MQVTQLDGLRVAKVWLSTPDNPPSEAGDGSQNREAAS
jgi:hypothetical protein